MKFTLNVRTKTPGNSRCHWRAEWQATKQQRNLAYMKLLSLRDQLPPFPVKVKLTRLSIRNCDKHNLPGCMKATIDGIADFYKVDDGDDRWQFEFAQRIERFHGVEVEIEAIK